MNYFRVQSSLIAGIQAFPVTVECAQSRRLPYLQILGGSGSAAAELRERVIAALDSSQLRLPARRITVQFQPEVRGLSLELLDLAVAVAILGGSRLIPPNSTEGLLICGSLGLDGSIRPARHEAAFRRILREGSFRSALLPWEGSEVLEEAQLASGGGFRSLKEVVEFLQRGGAGRRAEKRAIDSAEEDIPPDASSIWSRIEGQEVAKRMIEIAAAGAHHVLLPGPKSARPELLAHALSSLLPSLCAGDEEEVRGIYALAGIEPNQCPSRPFFVFGSCLGLPPLLRDRRLAEVEELLLAHRGVLYVDKICEREPILFPNLLDPMESGRLQARVGGRRVEIPASPIVVASSPICGCGAKGDDRAVCTCRPTEARKYQERWRSLLRYPFDLCLRIAPDRAESGVRQKQNWNLCRAQVATAMERSEHRQGKPNGRLGESEVFEVFPWKESVRKLWKMWELRSPARLRDRYISLARVSLTLCDLRGGELVEERDLLEAHHFFSSGEEGEPGRKESSSGAGAVNSTAMP